MIAKSLPAALFSFPSEIKVCVRMPGKHKEVEELKYAVYEEHGNASGKFETILILKGESHKEELHKAGKLFDLDKVVIL